jgi:hypothetical protein
VKPADSQKRRVSHGRVVADYASSGVGRLNLLTRGARDRDGYLRSLEANAPARLVR